MYHYFLKYKALRFVILIIALWLHLDFVLADTIKPWTQLTPIQQEALSPLASQWDNLPSRLQNHLLLSSKQYPKLTAEKKKRFLTRLEKWSKLTPEQREHARQKYLAISKLSAEKREQLKRIAIEKASGKNAAASSVLPAIPAMQSIASSQPVSTGPK